MQLSFGQFVPPESWHDEFRNSLASVGYWSRREDSNTPSADYVSAALPLSYTGT